MARGTKVLTAALVVVILAVAVGGYFGWQSYQSLSSERTEQDAAVASLRRQLAEAKTSPTPTPTPTPAPTPIPAVTLTQYKVAFTPTADIADVTPTYVAASKSFAVNTKSLAALGGECANPAALGSVTRVVKGKAGTAAATKVATVGSYDYYLSAPHAACAAVATATQTQTTQAAALKTALAALK